MSNCVFAADNLMGSAGQTVRFTRVLVKNWRSFVRAHAELRRRVFIAGPASAGKSNFLDVFLFLRELAAPGFGLQAAVQRRGGVRRLRCLAARQDSQIGVLIHAGSDLNPAEWEYGIEFGPDRQGRPVIRRERLRREGELLCERPDAADMTDPERLYCALLEPGMAARPFREFAAFLSATRLVNPLPAIIRSAPFESREHAELGAGLLEAIAATPEKSRTARLRAILYELRAAVPLLSSLESHRDGRGRAHLRALFEHWRAHGAWQSEAQLSDGVLRLTAVLWEILSGAGALLIKEPEASLHEPLVRQIPQMLARTARRNGRQILAATHSAALLEGPGVSAAEVLLVCPGREGSILRPALSLGEAAELLRHGALDAAAPAQPDERQMALFEDAAE